MEGRMRGGLGPAWGTSAFIERKGASKEPEKEQPVGWEWNKEAMVSYKEENRTFGGEIHQLRPMSWERTGPWVGALLPTAE